MAVYQAEDGRKARQVPVLRRREGQAEAGPVIGRAAAPITRAMETHAIMLRLVSDRPRKRKGLHARRMAERSAVAAAATQRKRPAILTPLGSRELRRPTRRWNANYSKHGCTIEPALPRGTPRALRAAIERLATATGPMASDARKRPSDRREHGDLDEPQPLEESTICGMPAAPMATVGLFSWCW